MKSVGLRAVIVGVCFWALAAAGSVQYKFSAAGTYPGSDYSVPLGVSKRAIVGYYIAQVNNQTIQGAYIETDDPELKFVNVRPFDSRTAYLSGINASGVAVGGYCSLGCNYEAGQHAFIYDHGKITAFDYPRVGAFIPTTTAYGISDAGQIVGGFCDEPYACPQGAFGIASHGFLDDHGAFTQLDYPGTKGQTQANAINNVGQIVGGYEINDTGPHAFLYANGQYQNIDYPNSGFTLATAINNKGVVAGAYQDQNYHVHGFAYHNGQFTEIDHPGATGTSITGTNDTDVIVGIWTHPTQSNFKGVPVK